MIHLVKLKRMPTTKKRINISLPRDTERALAQLAKRDRVPQATKALALLEFALEVAEDEIWDTLASQRDTKGTKFLSHEEVWK